MTFNDLKRPYMTCNDLDPVFQILVSTLVSYYTKLGTDFGVTVVGEIPSGYVYYLLTVVQ